MSNVSFSRRGDRKHRKNPSTITYMIISIFILVLLTIAYLATPRRIPRALDCSRPCESNALKDARVGSCTTRDAAPLAPRPHNFDPNRVYIAAGIVTPDNADHLRLRMWQRNGWFTYRDMMTVANGFSGKMFGEFVIGLNYEMGYNFSKSVLAEADTYRDILGLGLHELPREKKELLTTGSYGVDAEIVMTLKALAYYCYADRTYPNAKFVIKMDDDQYVRVPMMIRTADILPWKGAFWGYKVAQMPTNGAPFISCGISGMHVAMSKDVLHRLNTHEPLQRLARVQLRDEEVLNMPATTLESLYHYSTLWVEDSCVASAVSEFASLQNGSHIHYYKESSCRMHVLMDDKGKHFHHELNPHSMVVHHANESMEQDYIRLFKDDTVHDVQFTAAPSNETCYGRPVYEFKCPS